MEYKVSQNSIKLIDSYLVSKRAFSTELWQIRGKEPSLPLWERSERSLHCEWATHNLLYALGMWRSRTKDVDLNFEQKWYMKLAYGVVGTVALWVIK